MNEKRDKYITEAIGWCWHTYDENKPLMTYSLYAYVCDKCKSFILGNNDFSTYENFEKLLAWANNQENLTGLISSYGEKSLLEPKENNPVREKFLDELLDFLKSQGGKNLG
mgnify:CR=1 FL=1